MGSAGLVAEVELRRRWRELGALAFMIFLVSTFILVALVGAHRATTSVERFRSSAAASDASFQSEGQSHADGLEAVAAALRDVEVVAQRHLVNAFLIDGRISDIAILSDPAGRYGTVIDRPRVLRGRLPDASAPDELLLNELAAASTGLDVGDHLTVRTWSNEDLDALFSADAFPGFNGPQLDLEVVGVGRTLDELPGELQRTSPYGLASPAFLPNHPELGAWPPALYVRLRDGGSLDAISEALARVPVGTGDSLGPRGHYAPASTARTVYLDAAQGTADSLAIGLLILATVAVLAGSVIIGQAVTRHVAGSSAPPSALRLLGESRRHISLSVVAPIAAAAITGTIVATGLAAAASPILPVGLARRAEPDPGIWLDPPVLVPAAVAIVLAIVAFAAMVAGRAWAPRLPRSPMRVTLGPRTAARAGAPPTVLAGIHLAVHRGGGNRALPVRSALVALAVGVAGVLGASVVTSSNARLGSEPQRWGWNWSSAPDTFDAGANVNSTEARLALDARLASVGSYGAGSIVLGERPMTGYAMEAISGDVGFTRKEGRLPSGPGEVALGAQTMDDLGVSIGDTVSATDAASGRSRRLTVVGAAVLPYDEGFTIDVGAVLTPEGLDRLVLDQITETLVLTYRPGVDATALERELATDYGLTFTAFSDPQTPGSVRRLAVSADIATALAGFFVVVAVASLLHALYASARRRRLDLAVLRALGFTRSQVTSALLTQGAVLGLLGLAIGIPSGLITGRLAWRLLVRDTGLLAPPTMPWPALAAVTPATLVVVLLVSWWPGRTAARRTPTHDLRTE